MSRIHRILNLVACAGIGLMLVPTVALSQNYGYVDLEDLKVSPHLYWAKGIVFRDVLSVEPGGKTKKLDDRSFHRFETRELGEVYADTDSLSKFDGLAVDKEYYFSGTIAQKGRKYYYIVNNVSAYVNDAEYLKSLLSELNNEKPTNQYNQVFMVLENIMQDVHNDLFGYSTTQNIPINKLIGDPAYRQIVAAACRTALRRFEDTTEGSAKELFISTIISMMALQYGYADTSDPQAYEAYDPDEAVEEVENAELQKSSEYKGPSEEEWDLSEEMVISALEIEVVKPKEDVVEKLIDDTEEISPVESAAETEAVVADADDVVEVPAVEEPVVESVEEVIVTEEISEEVAVPVPPKIEAEEETEPVEEVKEDIQDASIENVDPAPAADVAIKEAAENDSGLTEEMVASAVGIEIEAVVVAETVVEEKIEDVPQSVEKVTEIPVEQAVQPVAVEESANVVAADSEEKESSVQEKIDYTSPLRIR